MTQPQPQSEQTPVFLRAQQKMVNDFNGAYPLGTWLRYWTGVPGESQRNVGKVIRSAWLIGGGELALVAFHNCPRGVPLACVEQAALVCSECGKLIRPTHDPVTRGDDVLHVVCVRKQ